MYVQCNVHICSEMCTLLHVLLYLLGIFFLMIVYVRRHISCNSDSDWVDQFKMDLETDRLHARVHTNSARLLEVMSTNIAQFLWCLLHLLTVHLVSCKQFTLNVPQVRGGMWHCMACGLVLPGKFVCYRLPYTSGGKVYAWCEVRQLLFGE